MTHKNKHQFKSGDQAIVLGDSAAEAHRFPPGTKVMLAYWRLDKDEGPGIIWKCFSLSSTFEEAEWKDQYLDLPHDWWVHETDLEPTYPPVTPEEEDKAIRSIQEAQGGQHA